MESQLAVEAVQVFGQVNIVICQQDHPLHAQSHGAQADLEQHIVAHGSVSGFRTVSQKQRSVMTLTDEDRKIEGRDLFDQHGQQRNGIVVIGTAEELPPAITVEAAFVVTKATRPLSSLTPEEKRIMF